MDVGDHHRCTGVREPASCSHVWTGVFAEQSEGICSNNSSDFKASVIMEQWQWSS